MSADLAGYHNPLCIKLLRRHFSAQPCKFQQWVDWTLRYLTLSPFAPFWPTTWTYSMMIRYLLMDRWLFCWEELSQLVAKAGNALPSEKIREVLHVGNIRPYWFHMVCSRISWFVDTVVETANWWFLLRNIIPIGYQCGHFSSLSLSTSRPLISFWDSQESISWYRLDGLLQSQPDYASETILCFSLSNSSDGTSQ